MWLNAPGGLVHADGTPKPSYDALRGLIRVQWWLAPTVVRTDDQGRIQVAGMPGRYAVEVGGTRTEVNVGEDDGVVTVAAR